MVEQMRSAEDALASDNQRPTTICFAFQMGQIVAFRSAMPPFERSGTPRPFLVVGRVLSEGSHGCNLSYILDGGGETIEAHEVELTCFPTSDAIEEIEDLAWDRRERVQMRFNKLIADAGLIVPRRPDINHDARAAQSAVT